MEIINLLDSVERCESDFKKQFAEDALRGLTSSHKSISSKYLYDDEGSRLFKKITELDEYYPTRTEQAILESMCPVLPEIITEDTLDIIELGVGDGHKSAILIQCLLDKGRYVTYYPIDISEQAFELLKSNLTSGERYLVKGIVGDYLQGLEYTFHHSANKKLVLFLGSNIGNFNREEACTLLKRIRSTLNVGDYLLIGFDLKKDVDRLLRAYNDSEGVTREFNLNLLRRINRELDGEFDTNDFEHLALYNPNLSAMESHLLSLKKQEVAIHALGIRVNFEYYEPIHLEFSFKFNETEIETLCEQSGFRLVQHFSDPQHYFIDSLWQANV